jgi:hypothetical protein
MDKLGGILTGGLLGNMILGQFNLFFGIIDIEIRPIGGAGGTQVRYPEDEKYSISIRMNLFDKTYQRSFITNKHRVNILIKILNSFKVVKSKIRVNVTEKEKKNITVRIKE